MTDRSPSRLREYQSAYMREWTAAHPGWNSRPYKKEWAAKNRAHLREYKRRWYFDHPWVAAAGAAARKFGEKVHSSVFARLFMLPCFSCGVSPAMGVDHIVPHIKGGRNVTENLQPACLLCNTRKNRY